MIEWLNQNQGLVAVLLAIISGAFAIIFRFFTKKSNSPHITAGGNISAGGDIVVGSKISNDTRKTGIILEGENALLINCKGVGPDAGIIDKGENNKNINCNFVSTGNNIKAGDEINKKEFRADNNSGRIQQAGRDIVYTHSQRPKIDLDGDMPVSGGQAGKWINFRIVNIGNDSAVDIKYFLSYDDTKTELFNAYSKLIPNEKTRNFEFYYQDSDIFKRKVENLKINFVYKDTDGHSFQSGRNLSQNKRADGNYDINGYIGDYIIPNEIV
ncbi:MAG: hypothetical protein WCT11_04930 [Candidatus Magasanikbacteria bacterium]